MYKVFIKANILYISNTSLTSEKSLKKTVNIEFKDDEDFLTIIPMIETEHDQPVIYCLFGPDPVLIWRLYRKQYKLVLAGGGLVRNKKNKILFIYRNGKWDLPKGKTEIGETIEETALREVKEECGIKDLSIAEHIIDTYHTYDLKESRKLKRTSWFKMYSEESKFNPQKEEGITKIKWIKKTKLAKVQQKTYPSILDVLIAEEGIKIDANLNDKNNEAI